MLAPCVEVEDIERVGGSHSTAGVPQHREERMSFRGVIVLLEVVEYRFSLVCFEHPVTGSFALLNRGNEHLFV